MSDTTMSNAQETVETLGQIVQDVTPVVANALATEQLAKNGDYVHAALTGATAVNDALQAKDTVLPELSDLKEESTATAQAAAADVTAMTANIVATGMVGTIEHELGQIEAGLKSRIHSLLHGFTLAALTHKT